LGFVFPLIGPIARWTHVQLSVPIMVAIVFEIWKCDRKCAFASRGGLSEGAL
jgi:hypothetical protein